MSGKSWIMSQIYNYLEPKYNQGKGVMDGCHWFNADNGVFGTDNSRGVLEGYLKIFEALNNRNIIVEKFFLADKIYHRLHHNQEFEYDDIENRLIEMNFKTVFITFPEDVDILKKRIQDRLNLYPHYASILQDPEWYIRQQQEYRREIEKSRLPHFIAETNVLPDDGLIQRILEWVEG